MVTWLPPAITIKIIRSAQSMNLSVLYGSENKQRFFPIQNQAIGFYNLDSVCLQRGRKLVFKIQFTIYIIPLRSVTQ